MARKVGAKWLMAQYLSDHVGEVVDGRDLMAISGGQSDYGRRIRELRRLGFKISTRQDRADLGPRDYVLEELHALDPTPEAFRGYVFAETISATLRAEVLARNGYMCQHCGVCAGDIGENGRPVRLHIGHIVAAADGGRAEISNLRALCELCNLGEKDRAPAPPKYRKVMTLLRSADEAVQRQVLDFLRRKFEGQGGLF